MRMAHFGPCANTGNGIWQWFDLKTTSLCRWHQCNCIAIQHHCNGAVSRYNCHISDIYRNLNRATVMSYSPLCGRMTIVEHLCVNASIDIPQTLDNTNENTHLTAANSIRQQTFISNHPRSSLQDAKHSNRPESSMGCLNDYLIDINVRPGGMMQLPKSRFPKVTVQRNYMCIPDTLSVYLSKPKLTCVFCKPDSSEMPGSPSAHSS